MAAPRTPEVLSHERLGHELGGIVDTPGRRERWSPRGLIHSRAAKMRSTAETELLKEQTRQLKDERREAQR